jgi:hypothetical protein
MSGRWLERRAPKKKIRQRDQRDLGCPDVPRKIFRFRKIGNYVFFPLSHPTEGRLENVTDAGWDAVDAKATQDERR